MKIQQAMSKSGKKVVMHFDDMNRLTSWSRTNPFNNKTVSATIEYSDGNFGDTFRTSAIIGKKFKLKGDTGKWPKGFLWKRIIKDRLGHVKKIRTGVFSTVEEMTKTAKGFGANYEWSRASGFPSHINLFKRPNISLDKQEKWDKIFKQWDIENNENIYKSSIWYQLRHGASADE